MKNADKWLPTKYTFKKGKLMGSRNPAMLSVSSRLMADLTASFYQRYIPQHAKGDLADLGCGNVPLFDFYRKYVTSSTCVDWANSTHQNQYLDIACDLNEPLPLTTDSFDTIIISDVLEHIANPELVWREMARILKPKGKILLSVPFLYRIHEAPYDYFRYTEFALKNFAEKNKLRVIELKTLGGLPEVLTDIFSKNIVRLPLFGTFFSRLAQGLCRFFVNTGFGRKVSVKTGKIFPLGYFIIVENG
jgi:SAM-dependent methyltransferase